MPTHQGHCDLVRSFYNFHADSDIVFSTPLERFNFLQASHPAHVPPVRWSWLAGVQSFLLHNHCLSDLLRYLDNFITVGPPQSSQCAYNLNTAVSVCHRLGLPLHANKFVGPATSMTILGIELDSVNQVAHLPEDKLLALRDLIHSWMPCRWCRKWELESLIGHLHHAAKVVWPGRAFLRRFIDLLCCFRNKGHPVRINQKFCLDLQWWQQFLTSWHGVGFWLYPSMPAATYLEVTSDAAGAIGFSAYPRGQWFYGA